MIVTNNLKSLGVFKDYTDESLKSVFEVDERKIIEVTLLMNKEMMDVVCVPTHHFCNLGCKMCHLTNKGLNKKMTPITVDYFMEALIKSLCKPIDVNLLKDDVYLIKSGDLVKRTNKKKLLISFMGVGEPLLNLHLIEEVYKKEEYIKEIFGYEDIGYALATMMPNDNIVKLTDLVNHLNIPLKIHFSMHTPIDAERFELIPSTKVKLSEALDYLTEYRSVIQKNDDIMDKYIKFHRTNDPVEIHYTLIDNVNDSDDELSILCYLLKEYKIPIKFIRFNPINDLHRSLKEERWIQTIKSEVPDLRVKTYAPPGREIGSSCGEFTKHYYHQEIETIEQFREFEEWQRRHQIYD